MSRDHHYVHAVLKKFLAPLAALSLLGAGAGCELITPVDRSKVPGEGGGGAGGGSTSTATATSTGTSGACTSPGDCPGTDTDCQKRSCNAGVCGFDLAPEGMATSAQTTGDCKQSVCDGKGATSLKDDPTDVLDDMNDCTDDTCAGGAPKNTPKAASTACTGNSGKVCDGLGACVECAVGADCATGVCQTNKCVVATCADKVKNANETDTDCGGPDCGPCDDGLVCSAATDCKSGVCTGGVCIVAVCTDKVKNGTETDVDCGGLACPQCGPGLGCSIDNDCAGGSCSGSVCLPTCLDKVKNANETDVDCGGPTCSPCPDNDTCAVDGDCTSKVCKTGTCQAPACNDTVKNGSESDTDCGGICPPCNATQQCGKPADCASGVCTGGTCQGPSCTDLVKNGNESGVDCGGGLCPKCGTGGGCGSASDCASGVCTGGLCAAPACGDGVLNGSDTCDDGNNVAGDGCDATCATEAGYTCSGAPSACVTSCGDGVTAGAEACDDGNGTAADGCTACAVDFGFGCAGTPSVCSSTCGDGMKASNEACDDGNGNPNDGCTATCTITAGFTCTGNQPSVCVTSCGDGIKAGAEGCDDGGTTNGDGCSSTCAVEAGYACSGTPSVCATICGDGVKTGAEQCDDNNTANGDCCSSTCQIEAGCEIEPNNSLATANNFSALQVTNKINGFIKPAGEKDYFSFTVPAGGIGSLTMTTIDNFLGITCASAAMDTFMTLYNSSMTSLATNDDINGAANRCSSITQSNLAPGTYYLELKAFSSSATFAYTLQATLSVATCGNGIVEGAEECDGGATCAANCTLLPICGDNAVNGSDQCDDGNTVSGDGCSATCTLETIAEVEPNDTTANADTNAAAATPILITGSTNLTGTFSAAADLDIFSVSVAAQSTVRFEIFDSSGRDCVSMPTTTLKLLNSVGTQLYQDTPAADSSTASGISGCAALVVSLAPGTYYIKLGASAAGTYVFQAKFEADDGSAAEPDDTQAQAHAFPGRDMFIASSYTPSSDQDWYQLTIPHGGMSVRAETIEGDATTCESDNVDSIITLVNSAGGTLISDDDDGRGFCSCLDGTGAAPRDSAAHNLSAGTYYLKITGYSSAFNYRLAVTVR